MAARVETFPYSQTARAMRQIELVALDEAKQMGRYGLNGNPVSSPSLTLSTDAYESTFYHLKPRVITSFLNERVQAGKSTVALDIAGGDGTAIRDICERNLIEAGVTATLADIRNTKQLKRDDRISHTIVPGDVMKRKTWDSIDEWLRENNFEGFDLIMSRPAAGIHHAIPTATYLAILKRALKRLSPKDSMLVTQTPHLTRRDFKRLTATIAAEGNSYKIKQNGPSAFYLIRD